MMMNELATNLDPIRVGEIFAKSGMFPDMKDAAQCATKLIVGRGMGLTDYDSMSGLNLIQGKVTLAANLMAAAIKRSGKYDYRSEIGEHKCTITFLGRQSETMRWEKIGTASFTMEDAARAGLSGSNWKKYPKDMLFARAISRGYKQHCPDALGNGPVYVEAHGEHEIPKAEAVPEKRQTETVEMHHVAPALENKQEPQDERINHADRKTSQEVAPPPKQQPTQPQRVPERDAYDSHTYVKYVDLTEYDTGTLYKIAFDEPVGGVEGLEPGERKLTRASTFKNKIGQTALEFQKSQSPVTFELTRNGDFWNVDAIDPLDKPEPEQKQKQKQKQDVHVPLTTDDIPF
jgi:hypothetical protein